MTCKQCGGSFMSENPRKEYCSVGCSNEFWRLAYVPKAKRKVMCLECGGQFLSPHHNAMRCPGTCRKKHKTRKVNKRQSEKNKKKTQERILARVCKKCKVPCPKFICSSCSKILRKLYKYKLSYEGYLEMKHRQNDLCAICCAKKVSSVDHCHTTGRVRGLLCTSCNTGIGLLRESREVLMSAIAYLFPSDP